MATTKPDRVAELGQQFTYVCEEYQCDLPIKEYLFASKKHLACCPMFMTEYGQPKQRLYRFDFAVPSLMLAVEYEGGVGQQTVAHSSVSGILRDVEKHRLAAMLGWTVLRFVANEVRDGVAMKLLDDLLDVRLGTYGIRGDKQFYEPDIAHQLIEIGLAVAWTRN